MNETILKKVSFCFCPFQLREPAVGPCGGRAALFAAPTSPQNMRTTLTARGPSWLSPGTPSLWCSLTSSWRKATTFWRSAARRPRPYGKCWGGARLPTAHSQRGKTTLLKSPSASMGAVSLSCCFGHEHTVYLVTDLKVSKRSLCSCLELGVLCAWGFSGS